MARTRDRDRWLAALRRSAVFASLGDDALRKLCAVATSKRLARGQTLWQQGERPDAVAVVLSGRLDVVRQSRGGDRLLLNVLGPGDAVGLSAAAGEAHSADLVAADEVTLLQMAGPDLRQTLAEHPALALGWVARLGQLLGRATDELAALRSADLDARVRRALSELGRGRREIRFTHAELADRVGATRPHVSRVLKRFERAGAIRLGRGRIEIVDLDRLGRP